MSSPEQLTRRVGRTEEDVRAVADIVIEIRDTQLEHGRKLDTIENRFDMIENRFGTVENRFGTVENRFGTIENRLDTVVDRLGAFESQVTEGVAEILRRLDAR